jgi:hypothetical protein
MVTKMDEFDIQNVPTRGQAHTLESLCQEFDGSSFYGLEYIIEDFFQEKKTKALISISQTVDWFGLYD